MGRGVWESNRSSCEKLCAALASSLSPHLPSLPPSFPPPVLDFLSNNLTYNVLLNFLMSNKIKGISSFVIPHWFSLVLTGSHQFSLVLTGSHWFSPVLTSSHWFSLVLTGSHYSSHRIVILKWAMCVHASIRCFSSETACKNFVIFYMNIKYDLGMMHISPQFRYHPRWQTGSHFIALKTYFALVCEN